MFTVNQKTMKIVKYSLAVIFFVNLLFINISLAQSDAETKVLRNTVSEKCPANSDDLYNRKTVLKKFAEILNKSIPKYRERYSGFYIKDEKPGDFFVYDMTDPLNKTSEPNRTEVFNCVNFVDKHIYHFTSYKDSYSASHIAILENGKIKIFKSINCPNSKDKLDDVTIYIDRMLKDSQIKEQIIDRVKDYRKYGIYYSSDEPPRYCN